MNVLKNWAISVCGACFTGAIFSYLMPSLKFEKVLKIGLCAFMIIAFITPFIGGEKINDFSFFSDEKINEDIAQQGEDLLTKTYVNTAAEQVKKTIKEALAKKQFRIDDVEVSMHIHRDKNISINEIVITGAEETDRQKIYDYLKKKMNLEVTVR